VKNMCVCLCVCACVYIYIYLFIYLYIYTSDCLETVYELPLLPNNGAKNIFYTNRERCEKFTGYLSLGCRPAGDWVNTRHWTKSFTNFFLNRK